MAIYKRGNKYWYHFVFNNQHVQSSTKQGNPRVARQMEAAHRTRLAKAEVGIVEKRACNHCKKKFSEDLLKEGLCKTCVIPTLADFGPRFIAAMEVHCVGKPRTLKFWKEKLERLLEYSPLASAPLDRIDQALIADYVESARHRVVTHKQEEESKDQKATESKSPKESKAKDERKIAPATINRELATLRRLLRLAQEWNIIAGTPRVRMLKGERCREFVLSHQQEGVYFAAAPQPLHDVALLILDTGLRAGEALALEWRDIHLEPAHGGRFGYLQVRDGKSKNARRNVSLTARVNKMLVNRSLESNSSFVFAGIAGKPFLVTSLCHQHAQVRSDLNLASDFVIHSLRHTMLTRLGEAGADTFTIKRIAGHSSVTVSERYVHPTPEGLERAFERLEAFNREATGSITRAGISEEHEPIAEEVLAIGMSQKRQEVATVSATD